MDIDQLQILIPLLTNVGEGTFWLALLFIGQGYLTSILQFSGIMALLYFCYRLLQRCIDGDFD